MARPERCRSRRADANSQRCCRRGELLGLDVFGAVVLAIRHTACERQGEMELLQSL